MFFVATQVVSAEYKENWKATSLLRDIASSSKYHALIDTGALITGMDNYAVARALLQHLSPEIFDGVVYMDAGDRQRVLMRSSGSGDFTSVSLAHCGIPKHRRFTFYDQVHTTGVDIKQAPEAAAVLTIGKDMTFRDYAQGAYRMRGIGQGQSIHLFIIPEVLHRILQDLENLNEAIAAGMLKTGMHTGGRRTGGAGGRAGGGTRGGTKGAAAAKREGDGGGEGSGTGGGLVTIDKAEVEAGARLAVPAWLLLNSMRLESLQFVQMSLQEMQVRASCITIAYNTLIVRIQVLSVCHSCISGSDLHIETLNTTRVLKLTLILK